MRCRVPFYYFALKRVAFLTSSPTTSRKVLQGDSVGPALGLHRKGTAGKDWTDGLSPSDKGGCEIGELKGGKGFQGVEQN